MMNIQINNEAICLPDGAHTISSLLEFRNIPENGTAVALNGKLVPRNKWQATYLQEGDVLTIISAAFGG